MNTIILCLIFSFPLFAQDFVFDKEKGKAVPSYIGQVKLFKGKALITKKGEKKDLGHGDRFAITDSIQTMDKSIVKIQMIDETIITVGPNSEMTFEEFEFIDKNKRKGLFHLIKGQMSSDVKNPVKEGDLRYKTKHAVMGVRGTKLLLNYQLVGNQAISQFALSEGKAVVLETGKRLSHDLVKGDHLVLVNDETKNASASDKLTLPPEEIEKLSSDVGEKEFKPLLPLFDISMAGQGSPFGQSSDKFIEVNPNSKSDNPEMKLKKKDKSWQQNLDKLNEQLKDNQKKNP